MTDTLAEDELARLRHENELLRLRLTRLQQEVASMRPLVEQVKRLRLWDFDPYEVAPDGSWVAVDRAGATQLLAALAGIDHWSPWATRLEPRPQP